MTILFTLFLYFLAIRYLARDNNKITYLKLGILITALVILTDLGSIINIGLIEYIKYNGWQVIVAFVIFVIYIACDKNTYRHLKFNMMCKKGKKPIIRTAKHKLFLLLISFIVCFCLLAGAITVRVLDLFKMTYIPIFALSVGSVSSLVLMVILAKIKVEKFVLVIKTEEGIRVFSKKIENKGLFNYMECIGEINRYYIINQASTIYFRGDYNETHYAWILETENLKNYDLSKLPMEEEKSNVYGELFEALKASKGLNIYVVIENGKIVKADR